MGKVLDKLFGELRSRKKTGWASLTSADGTGAELEEYPKCPKCGFIVQSVVGAFVWLDVVDPSGSGYTQRYYHPSTIHLKCVADYCDYKVEVTALQLQR